MEGFRYFVCYKIVVIIFSFHNTIICYITSNFGENWKFIRKKLIIVIFNFKLIIQLKKENAMDRWRWFAHRFLINLIGVFFWFFFFFSFISLFHLSLLITLPCRSIFFQVIFVLVHMQHFNYQLNTKFYFSLFQYMSIHFFMYFTS